MSHVPLFILKGRDVAPATHEEWASNFGAAELRRVDKTRIGNFEISTVFVGINMNYGRGKPLVFESMVFDATKGSEKDSTSERWSELDCQRYATWDEAQRGHNALVKKFSKVKAKKK